MTTQEIGDTTDIPLPADLSIGRVVRRAIADRGAEWDLPDDLTHAAMIVATELASNALRHAAPPYVLRLSAIGQRVRIVVGDSVALPPTVRHYGDLALTGRGLRLVADCSSEWGVEGGESGKEVWAEVTARPGGPTATMQTGETGRAEDAGAPAPGAPMVRFLGVPVATYLALQEWNDAVVRECQLIAALEAAPEHLPPRLLELAVVLSERFASEREGFRDVLARAREDGATTVDLEESWPSPSEPAVAAANAFLAMMEELDDFSRTDLLLSHAPDPGVVRLRGWFVTEMQAQLLEHADPTPYRETDDPSDV